MRWSLLEKMMGSWALAKRPFEQYAENDRNEPKLTDAAERRNGGFAQLGCCTVTTLAPIEMYLVRPSPLLERRHNHVSGKCRNILICMEKTVGELGVFFHIRNPHCQNAANFP